MKILKIAGIFVAVLVVGFVIFLATFDVGKYRGTIQDQAKAALGRDVTIGAIKMTPSLTPAITLSDVAVANVSWGTRPQMLTLKRVEVHTELVPLLFHKVNITSLSVEDPDVWLETDAHGHANWNMGEEAVADASARTQSASGGGTTIEIGSVAAKGLKLSYNDPKSGRIATIAAKSLDIRFDGALQDMNISKITAGEGSLSLQDGKSTTDGTVGKFEVESKGRITDLGITNLALSDIKVTTKGDGAPMDAVLDKLSLDKDGVFQVSGKVNGADLKGKGSLAPIAVLAAFDKPFPAKLSLEALGLKADTDLQVAIVNNRPTIKGTISIPELDLRNGVAEATAAAGQGAGTPDQHVFPETPLPWDQLKTTDADVKVTVGKATLADGLVVIDVTLPIALAGGKLTVSPFSVGAGGGTLSGELHANAGDKTFTLKAEGKGMSAEALAKGMKKGDLVTQGPLDLHMDVHGAGASVHAVMASLNGTFLVGMGEGKIRSDLLNVVGGDVITQVANIVNPAAKSSPYTAAKCAVVNLQIANGIANTTDGIAFVSDKMSVTSSGSINLGAERIDLSISPKATGGLGIGLGAITGAIKVSGPLAHPGVGIDKAGAMKGLSALGAAFATGGVSVLAQGAKDRLDPGADPCQAARTWISKAAASNAAAAKK